jgi:exopolysaccharide production protein ExoQ
MPPILALAIWFALLVALMLFDPAKDRRVSSALWVPIIWMFIVATRNPDQWLNGAPLAISAGSMEDGNPVDRAIFLTLILLAIGILVSRAFRWDQFVARNTALTMFILFALVSVIWSDFPLVAFKRWFRDLGNYLMILVVLSEPFQLGGVRTALRRLFYLFIPLSIILIKYFPQIGMGYWEWTGEAMYQGPTTSKNALGAVCMVSALFFFWDVLTRWGDRKESRTKKILAVDLVFLGMTLKLLYQANSATSRVCFAIGCLVLIALYSQWGKRHVTLVKACVLASFPLYLLLAFGLDLSGEFARSVGRDPSLTDRTQLWKILLSMHTNPLVGSGYDSFWLGARFAQVFRSFGGAINEAHNGYLEIYLNLGVIGLVILVAFLVASYRNIGKRLKVAGPSFAPLALTLWTVMLFYNMTEAAFKFHWMWITFLMGAICAPEHLVRELKPVGNELSEKAISQLHGKRTSKGFSKLPEAISESPTHRKVARLSSGRARPTT